MAPLKQLERNADGTFKRHVSPLADPQLKAAARQLVRDNAPAHRQGTSRSPRGQEELAPMDKRSPAGRGRRERATAHVRATGDLDAELAELRERFDVPAEAEVGILERAAEYEDEPDAVLLGLLGLAGDLGLHAWADAAAQEAGYDGDPAIAILRELGAGDGDIDEAAGFAGEFGDDAEGAMLTAFAWLAEENGEHEVVDRLAERVGVSLDEIHQAIDRAVDDGVLDPDELEDADDADPSADAGDVDDDDQDELDELRDRFGVTDEQDLELLSDFAEQFGCSRIEALEQLAQHQGVSLAEIEQHAAHSAAGATPDEPAGGDSSGWDSGGAFAHSGHDTAGEPSAAAAAE